MMAARATDAWWQIFSMGKALIMKVPRRQFLHLAAGAAAVAALPRFARSEAYPLRPVRILVGFPPGGTVDIVARLMGQWLQERLGQPFVVENRPGASSNIATEATLRAPVDGYTLLLITPPNVINATLYEKLNFNFIRDIAPVASAVRLPNVMQVNPSVPAATVPEFIAYAKANPRKLNMASAGSGTSGHVSGELFKIMAGIDMVHVPYRGGAPAITDLIGGQVQVMFDNLGNSIEHIRAGRLRALAVTTVARSEMLPETPSVSEFIPAYEASFWTGFGAPRGTPAQIIDTLNKQINAALVDAKVVRRLTDLGGTVFSFLSADFGKFIVDETEKWAKVIKSAGIKSE